MWGVGVSSASLSGGVARGEKGCMCTVLFSLRFWLSLCGGEGLSVVCG